MSTLIEPRVLLAAKEYLLPDDTTGGGYAVVDSQFGMDAWGSEPIPSEIHDRLSPINTLQLDAGNPDALITPPIATAYRGTRDDGPSSLPVAVVEAKGLTQSGGNNRNAARVAITQAHAHLGETNVGYAAVPHELVREPDRSLARELNIGLLAIDIDGVELLERPRLVGTEASRSVATLRFHGGVGGTPVESFKKNHPKNALGYALAVQHSGDIDSIFEKYVIRSVADGRRDAVALGLVSMETGERRLTATGREVVRTISYHHGGLESALEAIANERKSRARFIDRLPVMGTLGRQVLLRYPPTQLLIDTLRDLVEEGDRHPSLATVAKRVARQWPEFAVDLFVSSVPEHRSQVLTSNEEEPLDMEAFDTGEIYSTHTTFQYKAMLYHCGLVTERGTGTKSKLDPSEETWALETPLID